MEGYRYVYVKTPQYGVSFIDDVDVSIGEVLDKAGVCIWIITVSEPLDELDYKILENLGSFLNPMPCSFDFSSELPYYLGRNLNGDPVDLLDVERYET